MPKVLIITYYWPPAGGGGVQRWLKFVKYLPEFGWQPVIYAPSNADYPQRDNTLEKEVPESVEVIRKPIWEPRRVYQWLLRKAGHIKSGSSASLDSIVRKPRHTMSWHQKVALRIRSNIFIPDARSPWIKPSVKFLAKYLKDHPVDLIITTGPPHSCHLIGRQLKRTLGLPWIADFRDPWIDIEFFPMLQLTKRSRRKHEKLQKAVVMEASMVITVSWHWAHLLKFYGAPGVEVITNGYDREDLENVEALHTPGKFILASVGTMEADRNPVDLWNGLKTILERNPDLAASIELHLIGSVDVSILQSIESDLVRSIIHVHGYVTHDKAMQIMCGADMLILSLNQSHANNARGLIPGKVFEYMATGNTVLVIGDQSSDVGRLIKQYGKGYVVKAGDTRELEEILEEVIVTNPGMHSKTQNIDPEVFERRKLTQQLCKVMESLI